MSVLQKNEKREEVGKKFEREGVVKVSTFKFGSRLIAAVVASALVACVSAVETGAEVEIMPSAAAQPQSQNDRKIEDEIIYFVLPDRFENGDSSNDRGGIDGGRLKDGFDPTDFGFYHCGDLK